MEKFLTNSDITFMFQILTSVVVYYSGIKLFSKIPPNIETLNDDIKIREQALKVYLLSPVL
jgi:hypothetical protein